MCEVGDGGCCVGFVRSIIFRWNSGAIVGGVRGEERCVPVRSTRESDCLAIGGGGGGGGAVFKTWDSLIIGTNTSSPSEGKFKLQM